MPEQILSDEDVGIGQALTDADVGLEPEFQSGIIAPKERRFSMYDVPGMVDKLSESPLPTYGMDVPTVSIPVALAKTVAGLGRGVVSPLGAAATALGPVEAAGPALKAGFGAMGTKGLADIAAQQITTPEARPKTIPQAVELAGQVLPQLAMAGAPLLHAPILEVPREFRRPVEPLKPIPQAPKVAQAQEEVIRNLVARQSKILSEGGTLSIDPDVVKEIHAAYGKDWRRGLSEYIKAVESAQEKPPEVVTAATYTNPETGETTTGPNHPAAAAEQGVKAPEAREARETPEYGFQVEQPTGKTEVVSRDTAEQVARQSGQLKEEPKGEKVHSDEILSPTEPGKTISQQPLTDEQLWQKAQRKEKLTTEETKRLDEIEARGEDMGEAETTALQAEADALKQVPPAVSPGEAQPTVPAAGKAEWGVSAPPAPAIPEGGISPAKVQPQAAARKARSEVQKVARTEGQRPAKEVKNELVGRIQSELDALIEKANFKVTQNPDYPQRWSIGESQAALDVTKTKSGFTGTVFGVRGGKQTITGKSVEDLIYQTKALAAEGSGSITIDIPGDGSFTVPKNGENLLDLLKRANRISTSSGGVAAMAPRGSFPDIADQAKAAASAYGSPEKAYLSVKRQIEQLQSQEPPRTADERAELSKQIDAAEYLQRELYGNTKPGQLEAQAEAARERLATYLEGAKGFEESIAKIEKVKKQTKAHKERLQDLKDRYQQNQAFIGKYEREANQFEQEAARLKSALEAPTPTPAKPTSMVGMGGAVPSEFEVSPQTPTSIKNAQVDVERAKRGLPAVVQPTRRAFGEVWDRAMAMIDRDPTSQDRLIESIRQKPRALNDVEDAMLLHRQIDLQNEYGKATRDLAQAFEDGRTDAVAEEKLRVARLSDDLLDIYNIGKKVGTETARGLNARKMMANEDFTLAKMTLEARLANDGKPLSDARYKEIQELHDKINATQKAYDDYVASTKERLAKLEIDKVIAEQKAAAAPKFDKRILDQAEKIVQGMEKFAEPASRRLRERLAQLGTTPDPSIIYDAAVVGSARIARLGLDLAKLTDSMVADFGEKIRPFMAQIWAESNKMLDNVTAKAPEAVRRAVKKADLAEIKTNVADNIADKVKKGQKDKITTQVHMLARALVKNGITDREKLIDAVHDVLKDVIPGITRRESMDAISGYGDFKQLSKDYISITLRGMKGEMQQLAKLDDMAKGQPPLKSGMERRTPTEIERRLIKEVNDAKNKFQVPVQDPNTQLKSALDTLKTTLKNRIADYQERIRTGDYAKRPRREIVLDPEASRLKAENERVKKIFQRGVALERLKNAQPIEKAGDWIVKWRRGFILSSIKTLGKLTTAAIQRAAITPAEEAIGGVIGKVVPELAKRAPREGGFNVKAEARAISQGITQGMQDAWKTLKTGQSDLDVLYGKEALLPPAAIDFFGHVHGALKAPVKRAEFARSLEKRTQQAVASGVDLSDPLVQSRLVIDSYKDANRAIFQQDNRVVTAYKRALQALEAKDKTTGEVPLGGKIASTTARVLLPIVKIPTNIVAETMQYATGSVTGLGSLARAYARGIEKLPPEQADLIMRRLKKGSLGAAVLALGYFNPEVIGGYYQPGEKRPEGTPKPGTIQLYGVDIPSWALHNPLIETLQIGATVRRVADSKLRKRDTENQGVPAGIAAGIIGLGEEVPFVREMSEVTKALNPHERGAFFGELSKSMLIPQFIQQSAQWMDPLKEPAKRKPQTAWQHVEMGIPILRQNVPVKGAGSRYYVP